MASTSTQRLHDEQFHTEMCENGQHWILCSNPQPYEKTQTPVSCRPGCKRPAVQTSAIGKLNFDMPNKKLRNMEQPHILLLQRRYPLTKYHTKSLTIGLRINEDLKAEIEFSITDALRNKNIYLDCTAWDNWNSEAEYISNYFNVGTLPINAKDSIPLTSTGDTFVLCRELYKKPSITIYSPSGVDITLMKGTFENMCNVRGAIEIIRSELENLRTPTESRYQFIMESLAEVEDYPVKDLSKFILNSNFYNPKSLIDCEIVALGTRPLTDKLEEIVY